MMVDRWLRRCRYFRRRWCAYRDHPQAPWSPVLVSYRDDDWVDRDGVLQPGDLCEIRAYRCTHHDTPGVT